MQCKGRINITAPVLKKLNVFWIKAACNTKWKLIVYNAVIVTKLLYGLENIDGPDGANKLLDTSQLKRLSKILHLHTTHVNRTNTNENIFQKANDIVRANYLAGRGPEPNVIRPLSEVLQDKRMRLLGHVLRRPRDHPMHQTTFATASALPINIHKRRVGRPRTNWTRNTLSNAYETFLKQDMPGQQGPLQPIDLKEGNVRNRRINAATLYQPPFCTDNMESYKFRVAIGIQVPWTNS